jgi:hypothetical protein
MHSNKIFNVNTPLIICFFNKNYEKDQNAPFFLLFFLLKKNGGGAFWKLTRYEAILKILYQIMHLRTVHMSHFLSKKTETANRVLKLKMLIILLGYIATF